MRRAGSAGSNAHLRDHVLRQSCGKTALPRLKLTGSASAVGGAAYLVARAIKEARVVGFEDLGMEAIYEFTVRDMPVTVAVDSAGNNVHTLAPAHWRDKIAREGLLQGA